MSRKESLLITFVLAAFSSLPQLIKVPFPTHTHIGGPTSQIAPYLFCLLSRVFLCIQTSLSQIEKRKKNMLALAGMAFLVFTEGSLYSCHTVQWYVLVYTTVLQYVLYCAYSVLPISTSLTHTLHTQSLFLPDCVCPTYSSIVLALLCVYYLYVLVLLYSQLLITVRSENSNGKPLVYVRVRKIMPLSTYMYCMPTMFTTIFQELTVSNYTVCTTYQPGAQKKYA